MNELTKGEVAGWIRTLIPYLEKPAMLAPEGFFDDDEYEVKPGYIVEYGDNLCPQNAATVLSQVESVKALIDLYKSLEK
jgi:hypothetical protein